MIVGGVGGGMKKIFITIGYLKIAFLPDEIISIAEFQAM